MTREEFMLVYNSIARDERGCRNWPHTLSTNGYARFVIDGITGGGHRAVLAIKLGRPVHPGMCTMHSCDNHPCIEMEHLSEGTYGQNRRDMFARGRGAPLRGDDHPARTMPHRLARGSAHGISVHTEERIRVIRALYATGKYSQAHLAEIIGVTQTNIGKIVLRKLWRHVP